MFGSVIERSRPYVLSLLLVGLASLVSVPAHLVVSPPNLSMLYLAAVVAAALHLGLGPAIVAAAAGVLALDLFFVPPRFTLTVADSEYLLTFAGLFVVGVVVASLTAQVRTQSMAAERREAEARRLYEVSRDLASERARLLEEARRAHELEAVEKLQTALLDSISHDLRTPLVTITGALTALEDEAREEPGGVDLDAAARRSLLAAAREEAERLNRLVGNLLDITRLEAGALRLVAAPADVEEIVGSALEAMSRRLVGHRVVVRIADGLPPVAMDSALMVQVLANLLDNAAKHAPPGTAIELTVGPAAGGISIAVGDRGPGVPPPELDRIFDKFHRVQRSDGAVGTGLGLAICKGIVEAHGGWIAARNRRDGGLEIAVHVPESADDRPAAVRADDGGGRRP